MATRKPKAKEYVPWMPENYDPADAAAVQAVANGIADEVQQKRAMSWVVNNLCRTYDSTFFPESERNSVFADGKRSVGLQLVKLIKINVSKITKKGKQQPTEQG